RDFCHDSRCHLFNLARLPQIGLVRSGNLGRPYEKRQTRAGTGAKIRSRRRRLSAHECRLQPQNSYGRFEPFEKGIQFITVSLRSRQENGRLPPSVLFPQTKKPPSFGFLSRDGFYLHRKTCQTFSCSFCISRSSIFFASSASLRDFKTNSRVVINAPRAKSRVVIIAGIYSVLSSGKYKKTACSIPPSMH